MTASALYSQLNLLPGYECRCVQQSKPIATHRKLHCTHSTLAAGCAWQCMIKQDPRSHVQPVCHSTLRCHQSITALPSDLCASACLQACERALTKVQGHQKVSCVPGIASLARKNRLIATLVQIYGEGAFELTPRSWLLPHQYWHWRVLAEAQVPT